MGTEADQLKLQADKQLASAGSGFSFFGGREEKYQDAADLYIQAANAFRMQKQSRFPMLPVSQLVLRLFEANNSCFNYVDL